MLEIVDLQTEYRSNPIGLDESRPAFSWKLRSDGRDIRQAVCRVQVLKNGESVWDTGFLETDRSVYHVYSGEPLEPRTVYRVLVEVSDRRGETASGEGFFETGLDWPNMEANWITHGFADDLEPCAVFRRRFRLRGPVARARAYVTALGIYEMTLNGKRVGDAFLAPGWTSYQERLQVQTFDLAPYLLEDNSLEITVGNGWYKGILGFYGQGCHYGPRTALLAQVEILYADGSLDRICTDESWISSTGPRRFSEIYHGETIDLSLPEQPAGPARTYAYTKDILVGQVSEPVRITRRVPVRQVLHSPKGETILDFGQNLAGVIEARVSFPRGTRITLRHAEALDEHGNLFTVNLRTAKATDVFTCSGGEDVFLPAFTYHGFRYAAVEGIETVDPSAFTACVMHTDFAAAGDFACGNEKITRLWQNIDWTMRSNYLDIPMDCPQRDERLGYTGDAQIFLPTAVFHGNLALFYRKWLRDLCVEQNEQAGVPLSVPDILRTHVCTSIWHDAATIVPWVIYQTYGDLRVLEEQYASMRASVEYTQRLAGDEVLLTSKNSTQFGDWVALDAPKGPFRRPPEGLMYPTNEEKGGGTDPCLIGNVYYLYSIDILAKAADALGRKEEADEWRTLRQGVLARFRSEYITPAGRLVSETQTAAALLLYFGLAEEKDRPGILNRLYMNLIRRKKHLFTGFVGTQYLPHALSACGMHQLMGDILFREDCPSWLYEVNLGATTVWELWDGVNPDGSFNLFEMNSLNQYGFATIGDWLVKELAGLSPLEPGYRKSRIAPRLVRGIPWVRASYETPYGLLSCELHCEKGRTTADLRIPENTFSLVSLPGREPCEMGSGTYHLEYAADLSFDALPYTEDSTLNELLAQPAAAELFAREAPELAGSGFIRTFVGNLTLAEIRMTLPRSFVPQSAVDLFEKMAEMLNRQAAEGGRS